MDIQKEYQIAALEPDSDAVKLLQEAEATIAELTGREVTLIAYERSEDLPPANPT
jgi:hypothetical protein